MKSYVQDDVLFTKDYKLLTFIKCNGFIEVKSVGVLYYHLDSEVEDSYVDEGIDYGFSDIHYVYINNDVVYLNELDIGLELHNDLVVAYNEVEEVHSSFKELSDSELIEVRESMSKRLRSVLSVISKYVSDDDIIALL